MLPESIISELRTGKIKELQGYRTAIEKEITDAIFIHSTGIQGDEQAESFHGGSERAVLQFNSYHYARLKKVFPHSAALMRPGAYGENLVVAGMDEHGICIGDQISVGDALLEVSQPRQPCFKLNKLLGEPSMARYSQHHSITGWFYRVIQEGTVKTQDTIRVIDRPYPQWTIARIQHYLYQDTDNRAMIEQLADLPPLGAEVKAVFEKRIKNNCVEDWDRRLEEQQPSQKLHISTITSEPERAKKSL